MHNLFAAVFSNDH